MHSSGLAGGLECPSCALRIPWDDVSTDIPFRCPGCDADLCLSPWYGRAVVWGGLAIAGVIAYLFGFQSDSWLVFVCLTFLLFGLVISILLRHYWPFKLRLSDSSPMDLRSVRERKR